MKATTLDIIWWAWLSLVVTQVMPREVICQRSWSRPPPQPAVGGEDGRRFKNHSCLLPPFHFLLPPGAAGHPAFPGRSTRGSGRWYRKGRAGQPYPHEGPRRGGRG